MSHDKQSLDSLYDKYPKLKAVDEALDAYFNGKPITTRCTACGELLSVYRTELETGTTSTWVSCPHGCTQAHLKGHKDEPTEDKD